MPLQRPALRGLALSLFASVLLAPDLAAPEQATVAVAEVGDADFEALYATGEGLYLKNCRMCHGTKGSAGVPLAGSEKLEFYEYMAGVVIAGRGYMPAFGEGLSDDEIAAIVTYVRNSWGNAYGVVTPEDITGIR